MGLFSPSKQFQLFIIEKLPPTRRPSQKSLLMCTTAPELLFKKEQSNGGVYFGVLHGPGGKVVRIKSGCHQSTPAGTRCVVVKWLFIVGERRWETSVYFIPTAYIFLHLSGSKPKFSKPRVYIWECDSFRTTEGRNKRAKSNSNFKDGRALVTDRKESSHLPHTVPYRPNKCLHGYLHEGHNILLFFAH